MPPVRDHATVAAAWLLLGLLPGCLDWDSLQSGRCGDGFVGREEGCDDGNRRAGDGCDERCAPERRPLPGQDAGPGERDAGPKPTPPECGNGALEAGEGCDDRNKVAGDGCSETCQREPAGPLCGNGRLERDEICDDKNASNADGCLNGCSLATCGDGQVRTGVEECDPASPDNGELCTSACLACTGPGTYFRAGTERCFTLHAEPATQAQARAACFAEGGDLWTITGEDEGDRAVAKLGLSGPYWLGLLTSVTDNHWVTGETVKFTSFAVGEPTTPAAGCVSLTAGTTGAEQWQSQACDTKLSFVCERAAPLVSLPSNHAYSIRTESVTHTQARQRCADRGSALAALESEEERIFVGYPVNLRSWVDAIEQSEGMFVWPNGTPIDGAAFRAGQPDDSDGTQGCLVLDTAHRLSDERCDQLNAYVCERP